MKYYLIILGLSIITVSADAQQTPKWVSDKGYWVVESNISDKLNHVVFFYTNDGVMIYKESLRDVRLQLQKKKVKLRLKKVLETSITAWERKKIVEENKDYVLAILK